MKERPPLTPSAQAMLDRARTYCAEAEQCESGVRQKLVAWGISSDDIDYVVERLVDDGYIDDQRYARAYCESKLLRQHWGKLKVTYQLRTKHLSERAIRQGLDSVDDEQYSEAVLQVLEKKLASLGDVEDYRVRQKLFAYMAQRGFTTDDINKAINNKTTTS